MKTFHLPAFCRKTKLESQKFKEGMPTPKPRLSVRMLLIKSPVWQTQIKCFFDGEKAFLLIRVFDFWEETMGFLTFCIEIMHQNLSGQLAFQCFSILCHTLIWNQAIKNFVRKLVSLGFLRFILNISYVRPVIQQSKSLAFSEFAVLKVTCRLAIHSHRTLFFKEIRYYPEDRYKIFIHNFLAILPKCTT